MQLRISNVGSLALKYGLTLEVYGDAEGLTEEKAFMNAAGETAYLSDYLVFNKAASDVDISKRENLWIADEAAEKAAMGKKALAALEESEAQLEAGEEESFTLTVYMPTWVGNEANYRGDEAPEIYLGVALVATQATVETDSFDNQYDAGAKALAADLENKLTAGGDVKMVADVSVPLESAVSDGSLDPMMTVSADTSLDLAGKTLSLDQAAAQESLPYVPSIISVADGTLTLRGNGVIDAEAGYNTAYGITVDGGTLVIDGGTYYGAMSAVQVSSGTAIINGGFFDLAPTIKSVAPEYATYLINCIDAAYKDGTAKVEIRGGTFVNFDPSNNGAEGAGTDFVPDGYTVVSEEQTNGDIWYTVQKISVEIGGVAGLEGKSFSTLEEAYAAGNAVLAPLGLGEEAVSDAEFDAVFTDGGTITWTINGSQTLPDDERILTFGRASNRYSSTRSIRQINVVGSDGSASLTMGSVGLPYAWWNDQEDALRVSFSNLNITGAGEGQISCSRAYGAPLDVSFDHCVIAGNIYHYFNGVGSISVTNCRLTNDGTTGYAFFVQGSETDSLTVNFSGNEVLGFTRGINIQQKTAEVTIQNNRIISENSEPDRGAVQLTDAATCLVDGNYIDFNAGNAIWFHEAATNDKVQYTITDNTIMAPYLINDDTAFGIASHITSSGNNVQVEYPGQCMEKDALEASSCDITLD